MTTKDLSSFVDPVKSLEAVNVTAAVDGVGVDLQGFESAAIVVDVGLQTGTVTPTINQVIEDSPDNSVWTAVVAAELDGGLLPAIVAATDKTIYKRGYKGAERYVRYSVSSVSGTAPEAPISAVVVRGNPARIPVGGT